MQPDIVKSVGHSKISNQNENAYQNKHESSQNKLEFCNETQPPNLFKQ